MNEKERLVQEKLKHKECCATSKKLEQLLACWYGADAIPAKDREDFKKETAEKLRETIEQILADPKKSA